MEMGLIVLTNGPNYGGGPPKKQQKHDGLLNLPHDNTCLDTFLSCENLHMQIWGLPDLIRHVVLSNAQKDNESKSEGCC